MFKTLNQKGILVIEWLVIMAIIAGIGAGYMLADKDAVVVERPATQVEKR